MHLQDGVPRYAPDGCSGARGSVERCGMPISQASITPASDMDRDLDALRRGAERWVDLPVAAKAALLLDVRQRAADESERWTLAAARAKGIEGTPLAGEEAISGPWALIRALGQYVQSLNEIERFGAPQLDARRVASRPDGQRVVGVFPRDGYDRALLHGIRAEVWMEPGQDDASVRAGMGAWYRTVQSPRVALVLGAGNIASIAPLDVLYKLLADGAVCILKLNPVNQYLGPIFETIFAPLVREGYLRFAYGGSEVGKYLCAHPLVDEIHITGSEVTHDRIVFGDDAGASERKARNMPLLRKPISSELGNVSPTIVVPGSWSDADFRFQAEQIATQKLHNDGFNCVAAQVLVLPEAWAGTPKLIASLKDLFATLPRRPAYYPGASARLRALGAAHEVLLGADAADGRTASDGYTPPTLLRVDLEDARDDALRVEAFSSVLAIVTLPGEDESYLEAAVRFANERLHGTLGANLIVHPRTFRRRRASIDRAIAALRYGCVAVNTWSGVGFFLCEAPWGAFPGHTVADAGSGIGVVHNTHLFSRTQKTVVYGPFAPFPRSLFGRGATLLPKPPWFVTHRNAARIGSQLCRFEMRKTPLRLARIAWLALTG